MKNSSADRQIPLYDIHLSAETRRRVEQVLRSGWLTTGSVTAELERRICRRLGVRHGVAVNSNTAGMELVLRSLGIGAGKEVVTSPFTFVASAEAILNAGAQAVFADIDLESLTLDPEEVARRMSHRTGAILAVDIAGHPCDYRVLKRIADHFGVPLIADAAHGLGSTYRKRSSAAWCDAAVYSFHATKNLTCGEGGMVLSRHKPIIEAVRTLSLHGLSSSAHQRRKSGGWKYDLISLGMKANMPDVLAAIGVGEMESFDQQQAKRNKIVERYRERLAGMEDVLMFPSEPRHIHHGWHLCIVRLNTERLNLSRDQVIARLRKLGVECGVHYRPLCTFSLFRSMGVEPQHYPNAMYAGERVLSLPLYPHLKLRDVDYVCRALRDVLIAARI